MAKSTATPTRSDAIRDYVKKHNDAGVKAIQEALKEQGVEVSAALVSKVKYRSGTGKKKRGLKATTKPPAISKSAAKKGKANSGEKVNKSAEIRNTFRELGKQARPKDVVAALAEKGITVSSAQVSMVRFNMKAKKAARRAAAPAEAAAPKQIASMSRSTGEISGHDLIEAKRLADQLGGVERLKAALDVLAQLT